jgi:peptidoglycan LD-endopeptidase LytH
MTLIAVALLAAVAASPTSSVAPRSATPTAAVATPIVSDADLEALRARALVFPVPAVSPSSVHDTFAERRGGHVHEALDITATRGVPVVAVDDGVVAKLFHSVPGGLTVYLFDRNRSFAYYYAHLDGYAAELVEGKSVARGEVIGYVGTTGNAGVPHLHFAIFKLETPPRWWHGTPIDPYPLLVPLH